MTMSDHQAAIRSTGEEFSDMTDRLDTPADTGVSSITNDLPTGPDNRIVVENLNIYYGAFLAVKDVNMVIEPRSVTALIGASGCGKSTFIRSLNRMHEVIDGAHVQGSVYVDGEDLYGPGVDPVAVRRKVGMVFQRPDVLIAWLQRLQER